jgi:pimeloyl-ACP methyl ester carboxylesterase
VYLPGFEGHRPETIQNYPTISRLSTALLEILNFFQLKRCFGMGIGMGATILLHATSTERLAFRGLILMGCSASTATWSEWVTTNYVLTSLRLFGLTESTKHALAQYFFHPSTMEGNGDLCRTLSSSFNGLEPHTLRGALHTWLHRPAFKSSLSHVKNTRVLMICGRSSPLYAQSLEAFAALPSGTAEWLPLSKSGTLASVENPQTVFSAITLFVKGFG